MGREGRRGAKQQQKLGNEEGTTKRKKNPNTGEVKYYNYYYCTKRKKGCSYCTQSAITVESLEYQINTILESIDIKPQFREWALEIVKRDFHKELEEKESIRANLEKQLRASETKLNNLIDLLTD